MVVTLLGNRLLNFDAKFGLSFKEKTDLRDTRPLFYDGRVVIPTGTDLKEYFWARSSLLNGKVQECEQRKTSAMTTIEEVGDTALPTSTDTDGTIRGAQRFAQVGPDAYEKIYEAGVENLQFDGRSGILWWDLNPHNGDAFDAFISKRMGACYPLEYFAAFEDLSHFEWFRQCKVAMLRSMHQNKTLTVTGFADAEPNIPDHMITAGPPKPQLKKLALVVPMDEEDKAYAVIPESVIATWADHPEFGEQFKKFQEELSTFRVNPPAQLEFK